MCHFYFYDSFGKYGLLILDKNYCTVIFSNELVAHKPITYYRPMLLRSV